MSNWADMAIAISERFNALIFPLISKKQPGTKLNAKKYPNLPPEKLPSSDPIIIRKWAQTFPGFGVMPLDNLLIVDIDVKEGQNGKASLKFLKEQGLSMDTFIVKSPSGGLHLYYQNPSHYQPVQTTGEFIQIKFEDPAIQSDWDDMQSQSGMESTGVDTRYGVGYVVGPGSDFDGTTYTLLVDKPLAQIPATIQIGYKTDTVKVTTPKQANIGLPVVDPGSIKQDRNEHAKTYTYLLSKLKLPEQIAIAYVRQMVLWYDNTDGESPSYEIIWDMYVRALAKRQADDKSLGEDVVDAMLKRYVYIISGKKVIDTLTETTYSFDDLLPSFLNQKVFANGSDKPVNPLAAWLANADRKTVLDTTFDIKYPNGIIQAENGELLYNKFRPPIINKEYNEEGKEYGEKMFDAIRKLFVNVLPDKEERQLFIAWVAALIFRPEVRLVWNWHIYSEIHGVGKDSLADVVCSLYGYMNCKRLSPSVFIDKFNKDLYSAGLVIMSDFASLQKKGDILQGYKSITGSSSGSERRMYSEAVQSNLSARFIILTNREQDFPVDKNDRRTFKSHCKSNRLEPITAGYVKAFLGEPVALDVAHTYNLRKASADEIQYCRAMLFTMLEQSGFDTLPYDCPFNQTKSEVLTVDYAVYIEEFVRLVNHKAFVFASDIVTAESIHVLVKILGIKTSIGTVMENLIHAGVLKKVVANMPSGPQKKSINAPALVYDKELDQLCWFGDKATQPIYSVRNHDLWARTDLAHGMHSREYKKIVGYPGISRGFNEARAEMIEKSRKDNVVDFNDPK